MSDAYMTYIANDGEGPEFRWHGGAYIDIGYTDASGDFHAGECINVYDYAKGQAEISTPAEFQAECERFLSRCENCGEDEDDCTCDDDADDECEACGEDRTGGDDDFCASCLSDMASKRGEIG